MKRLLPLAGLLQTFLCALLGVLGNHLFLSAQAPVDYNDVAVVVNENSDISKEIGAYFAQKRSIPAANIIRVSVPNREAITDEEFQDLRTQIETYLAANDPNNDINYLVMTKGVPIFINRSAPNETPTTTPKASVDNELTLIAGSFKNLIGRGGWASHNYVQTVAHFDRAILPIFLITRLDAYTKEQVFAMIDNSGPNRLVNKDSALFVLDQDPFPIDSAFHQSQGLAGQILNQRGWRVLLNTDSVYITGQRNVLGYASWGSNDHFDHYFTQNAIPHNTWLPGALAETFVSTSGRSLEPGTGYGQSLIADWLAEGVVGAKGYVYEPFTIALALPHILFDRYTDESQDTAFNLAESFYMASRTLSWMDLVIGDPKTSIITEVPPAPNPMLPATGSLCQNDPLVLYPINTLRGAHYWFAADIATLTAQGLPYDNNNPLWIAGGRSYTVNTSEPGTYTYTYVNTNISGSGMTQITVTILPAPEPDFETSSDTVLLNEEVIFTDKTQGEGTRRWSFGDGTIATGEEHQTGTSHAYGTLGKYEVTLTIINEGCVRSMTKTVVVRSTSDVTEENSGRGLGMRLLPNPTADQTVVTVELERPAEVTFRLYDPAGRVLQEDRGRSPSLFRRELSLKDYPAGAYMIEVIVGNRRVAGRVLKR